MALSPSHGCAGLLKTDDSYRHHGDLHFESRWGVETYSPRILMLWSQDDEIYTVTFNFCGAGVQKASTPFSDVSKAQYMELRSRSTLSSRLLQLLQVSRQAFLLPIIIGDVKIEQHCYAGLIFYQPPVPAERVGALFLERLRTFCTNVPLSLPNSQK